MSKAENPIIGLYWRLKLFEDDSGIRRISSLDVNRVSPSFGSNDSCLSCYLPFWLFGDTDQQE